ncbi:hypothetical protein HGRIS_001090 [Hohenbuehelia grisea]|uniref:Uncharacterized protein n=1 Tax=Hohenbuehelia grisea TaxID=104357 RepID=A0ABR3JNZ5_9AGAR
MPSSLHVVLIDKNRVNLLTKHQENLERLEHIEDLVSYMSIRNAQSNVRISMQNVLRTPATDDVGINFLQRQNLSSTTSNPEDFDKCSLGEALEPLIDVLTASFAPSSKRLLPESLSRNTQGDANNHALHGCRWLHHPRFHSCPL